MDLMPTLWFHLKEVWDHFQLKERSLRVVYTMDCEVVPRPCEICDWLLNSSLGALRFPPRTKTIEWPWSLRFQKTSFEAYVIHGHDPLGFDVGEAKEAVW